MRLFLTAFISVIVLSTTPAFSQQNISQEYSQIEILQRAKGFFGSTTAGLAKAVERVFADHGEPNAFIEGEEFGGAFVIGLRYGEGKLHRKNKIPKKIYWQGPSVGYDFGGNASKVLTLVYNLKRPDDIYRRFPGIDGSLYLAAGVSLNYQAINKIVLAPIRTGLGLRAGASIGYLHYNQEHSWLPF